MKKSIRQAKTLLFSGTVIALAMLMGGCEQDFFVSPAELLTPMPVQKETPTPVPVKTSTPTPTAAATATPTETPVPAATATPAGDAEPTPEPTEDPNYTPTPSPIPTVKITFEAPVTDPADYTFIVNREHPLPDNYVPDGLTLIKHAANTNSSEDKYMLRSYAAEAFDAMCDEAFATAGLNIVGISGYRSFNRQYDLYANYLVKNGISHTNYYSAQPGTSEHQTGLAIDISCQSCGYDLVNSFARSAEGKWVAANCWRFGFILRYSEDDEKITGYAYEPWHIRYVGIPLAHHLYSTGLTLEEYYGCPSSTPREYLDTTPLIDTGTAKFAKIFYAGSPLSSKGVLAYTDSTKKRVFVNPYTYMPCLIPYLTDAKGNIIKDEEGNKILAEPVTDLFDRMYLNGSSPFVAVKPAVFENGELWRDAYGEIFLLDPLVQADGTFVRNKKGEILFREILFSPDSTKVELDNYGTPIRLIPKRDKDGNVIMVDDKVQYYYPEITSKGEYKRTYNGNIDWPMDYSKLNLNELLLDISEESPITKFNNEYGG